MIKVSETEIKLSGGFDKAYIMKAMNHVFGEKHWRFLDGSVVAVDKDSMESFSLRQLATFGLV